jgi:putative membrane protein
MRRMKFIILIAVVAFFGCNDDDETGSYSMSSDKFMQQAASSGKFEVATGRLASQQGMSSEVKSFGSMMVTDHSKANAELMALAASEGVTLPDTFDTAKQAKYSTLSQLTGVNFDKRYMDEMVLAHDADVAKFDSASKFANDAEVRAWAAKQLPVLQMHQVHAHELDSLTNTR